MNKILFFVFGSLVIGYLAFTSNGNSSKALIDKPKESIQEKIKIAACPTCLKVAEKLDKKTYQIIKTTSTAESVKFFQDKKVDIILAGRKLKPSEPNLEAMVIDEEGYSFLSEEDSVVYMNDLDKYEFYTDLDVELLKSKFPIKKIHKVDNVYGYISRGIIITSWANTDYRKSNIVHVYERNGERSRLSRQATVYYPKNIEEEAKKLSSILALKN